MSTAAPNTTHMNVFTVEEYESNGKSGKHWTKIGAVLTRRALDSVSSYTPSRSTAV